MADQIFHTEISAIRADVEAELEALLAELPAARAVAAEAKAAHEAADHRFHTLQTRVARATRHGSDDVMGATLRLVEEERGRRDRAAGAMVKARKHVETLEWEIGCKNGEIAQLDLVENPPPVEHRLLEVVKRQTPDAGDIGDVIVFPTRAA
jgi:hypothetical protein